MTAAVKAITDNMGSFILGALGLTYLVALLLILARPAGWRLGVWLSQVVGFGVTCFAMGWLGFQQPLTEALTFAVAGMGAGAMAAWRWGAVADDLRARARVARARGRR